MIKIFSRTVPTGNPVELYKYAKELEAVIAEWINSRNYRIVGCTDAQYRNQRESCIVYIVDYEEHLTV